MVRGEIVGTWTFGGGTALMLHIGHRESHDIDLFIDDPQALPYLNPYTQDYDLEVAPSSYDTDGTRSLKLSFDGVGEIDFICAGTQSEAPTIEVTVRGRKVLFETPWRSSPRSSFTEGPVSSHVTCSISRPWLWSETRTNSLKACAPIPISAALPLRQPSDLAEQRQPRLCAS